MSVFRTARLALLTLGLTVLSARAQVTYERELSGTEGIGGGTSDPVLPVTQAPIDTSNPLYDGLANDQYIFSTAAFYTVDPTTGVVSSPTSLVRGLRLDQASLIAGGGQGTSNPYFSISNVSNAQLYYYISSSNSVSTSFLSADIIHQYSLASANGTTVALTHDNEGDLVGIHNAIATPAFGSGLSSTAKYIAYGANGLLYDLDYGNNRVVALDPNQLDANNMFTQVLAFNLHPGTTTANEQFAIGKNGNLYLGDGLGGGSDYDAAGNYLGSFALPDGTVGDPYTGASYLSTDGNGSVYVYDSTTGFHQFQDTSISDAPEPGTWALLLVGGGVLLLLRERKGNGTDPSTSSG